MAGEFETPKVLVGAAAALLLTACSSAPKAPEASGVWVPVNRTTRTMLAGAGAGQSTASTSIKAVKRVDPLCAPEAEESRSDEGTGGSLLVAAFGAAAIRDRSTDGTIQLRLKHAPVAPLQVLDVSGSPLPAIWDDETRVLTFKRANRFFVTDGTSRVEVARIVKHRYVFDRNSDAQLEMVFDRGGATYFKFAEGVKAVSVVDAQGPGRGEQKKRYFRFAGVRPEFVVTADGTTVTVNRTPQVRFYERKACSTQSIGEKA
ncbi:hypothetical protein [Ralstonia chuxiongensis]|uniref:hypothetical protein n=1 Tax=Ralstonia chuxiongensis TaxID=2957504 RepID=UPI0028F59AC3|nr:hypothetical protein [Ralstonia chuxiongensis]CAJ0781443.1 hypothetical protein R8510_04874 [Ralstonia chuxiongensis]